MKRLAWIMAVAASMLSSPSNAAGDREVIGETTLDGRAVILYDDGFWRFGPDKETCHSIEQVGRFCASSDVWSVFPNRQTHYTKHRPEFIVGNDFWAQANSLSPWADDVFISFGDVEAFVRNRSFLENGLRPNLILNDRFEAAGRDWTRFVFEGDGIVKAFSITPAGKRYVIVETHERKTTLFASGHRSRHLSFINGLEIDDNE